MAELAKKTFLKVYFYPVKRPQENRMKIVYQLVPFLVLVVWSVSLSDKIATTDDGKKVLLRDDGTWKFATPGEVVETIQKEKATATAASQTEDTAAKTGQTVTTVPELSNQTLVDLMKSDGRNHFRNARWGMTLDQVKASETARLVKESPNRLDYSVAMFGYDCTVLYIFVNGKLEKAGYVIGQAHVDPAQYYQGYEDLKTYLQPLYGAPVADKYDWKNDMYRSNRSMYGFAISIGFLTCQTTWQNKATRVILLISGSNHQIATNLEYSDIRIAAAK